MGAAGAADEEGRPMTPETPFWLASVTKLYIAAATLRLYEQGRLELDAAMADYLPDELVVGLHRWKGAALTGEITVRHLLGHASGLPEYLLIAPDGAKTPFDRALEEGLEWGIREIADLVRDAEETLRFVAAVRSGRVFDDPASAGLMSAHFNRFGFSFSLRPVGPGWPSEYGLGMLRFRLPRLFSPLRATPALFGHTGVSGSWLFHCPDLRLTLSGTVDQIAGAAVPFRFVPRLVRQLDAMGVRGT
jgi:CubicO group peptidase (beta-lactamase class C family)